MAVPHCRKCEQRKWQSRQRLRSGSVDDGRGSSEQLERQSIDSEIGVHANRSKNADAQADLVGAKGRAGVEESEDEMLDTIDTDDGRQRTKEMKGGRVVDAIAGIVMEALDVEEAHRVLTADAQNGAHLRNRSWWAADEGLVRDLGTCGLGKWSKRLSLLNTCVRWKSDSEADSKHRLLIAEHFGLEEESNVPTARTIVEDVGEDEGELTEEESTVYRKVAARAMHLEVDLADLQFDAESPRGRTPTYEGADPLPQGYEGGDCRCEQNPRGRQEECQQRRQRLG